jgi:Fic family protein
LLYGWALVGSGQKEEVLMYVPLSLLRRHVYESNAIEGIKDRSGFYVQSHLAAALIVSHQRRDDLPHPATLHRKLAHNTEMDRHGGIYRTRGMDLVGPRGRTACPEARYVPELMGWWETCARQFTDEKGMDPKEGARVAFILHHAFLCIHPFRDGNGRTARLVLNSLRLAHGLPWLTIKETQSQSYYARIAAFERECFRPLFEYAY